MLQQFPATTVKRRYPGGRVVRGFVLVRFVVIRFIRRVGLSGQRGKPVRRPELQLGRV
jgi:hypothetical protein